MSAFRYGNPGGALGAVRKAPLAFLRRPPSSCRLTIAGREHYKKSNIALAQRPERRRTYHLGRTDALSGGGRTNFRLGLMRPRN